ncbi:MAG: phosphoribosyl-ATP diphosphatase [Acidiferrobacterales bacterium]|nr:phosphoribosyl-ATP diphosphatase [Acidiferrobacterales bacterium]
MRQDILTALMEVIESRKDDSPDRSYVASLHEQGVEVMSSKVVEEANETAQAAEAGDIQQVVYETADLWFHSLVLLSRFDLTHDSVLDELNRRFGVSGLEEKKSRS